MDDKQIKINNLKNNPSYVLANKGVIIRSIKNEEFSLKELIENNALPKSFFSEEIDAFLLECEETEKEVTIDILVESGLIALEDSKRLIGKKKKKSIGKIRKRITDIAIKIKEGILSSDVIEKESFFLLQEIKKMKDNDVVGTEEYNEFEEQISQFYIDDLKTRIKNGECSDSEICTAIKENKISKDELIREGILTEEEIKDICDEIEPPVPIDFGNWKDVPKLKNNRLDVFVLGVSGSGKSTFMAGLLYYAQSEGKVTTEDAHKTGYKYYCQLTQAVENGKLPPLTPVNYIQHLPCGFESIDKNIHPFTFIEMSGEVFEKCIDGIENANERFREYLLESTNRKIFFLVVDYEIHDSSRIQLKFNQQNQFINIVNFLSKNDILESTDAICLLLSKWDKHPDYQNHAVAGDFLDEKYKNLVNVCRKHESKIEGLDFVRFPYCLGKVDKRQRYSFDKSFSSKIFEWMTETTSFEEEENEGFFSKIFGKKK